MIDVAWHRFLAARGIDASRATMRPMPGGEINDTWLITEHGPADGSRDDRRRVLRHYRRTSEPAEIDCELSAIDHLARHDFPTPAVIPRLSPAPDPQQPGSDTIPSQNDDRSAGLWEVVDGRPAALFAMAPGQHPPERAGGYGTSDLALGVRAARLAGELHRTLGSLSLAGGRVPERDSWRQIAAFIAGPASRIDLFADLLGPLGEVYTRLAPLYANPSAIPSGLIHNDIRPPNLLLDTAGKIVALLDFDDCAQTFLGYELGALISNFGKDDERRVIMDRVLKLITGYDETRPLTTAERCWLPDLLIAHAGAEGVRVVSHWLSIGRKDVQLRDSYSVGQFLDLVDIRDDLAEALQ